MLPQPSVSQCTGKTQHLLMPGMKKWFNSNKWRGGNNYYCSIVQLLLLDKQTLLFTLIFNCLAVLEVTWIRGASASSYHPFKPQIMIWWEGEGNLLTEFHFSVAADLMVEKWCIGNVKFMFWILLNMHGLNENITELEMWNKNNTFLWTLPIKL